MKIATFNCNSLRVRLPIVLDWLEKERPDALGLQETKVTDDLFPQDAFTSIGWKVTFVGQKSYNGVAFVTKKPLEDVTTSLPVKGGPPEDAAEARFIAGKLDGVLLVNTYVPQGFMPDSPKFQKKLRFYAGLKAWFAKKVPPASPAVWMGDLNVAPHEIDLWDPKRNQEHVCFHPKARAAFEAAREGIWTDLFREKVKEPGHYTYWDYMVPTNLERNRGWRIDHLLGTRPMVERLKDVWIDKEPRGREKASDHTFLAATFK
jgi:exodeoxyribonuclease-3